MIGDGSSEAEVKRRNQVGANMWRRAQKVMADRKISRKLKGTFLPSCVMSAYLYGLETVACDKETTEVAGLREQLGQEDCESKEGAKEEDG